MKTLVVYYSRTQITKKVAERIASELNADLEEIIDTKSRSGPLGYLISCYDALRGKTTILKPIKNDPSNYDLVIVGTPVWAGTMSTPILTYLSENKDKFKNVSEVGFFSTAGSSSGSTIDNMAKTVDKYPVPFLTLNKIDIKEGYDEKLDAFIKHIKDNQGN